MMKSPYELDHFLGLSYFISSTPGVGGRLRQKIEDFIVEEIFEPSEEDEKGEYVHFILEKRDWDTIRAIDALAKALGVSRKRFGYAGTKDKRAITKQRVSAWKIDIERLKSLNIHDIRLHSFMRSSSRVNLGDLIGNRFTIVVRDVSVEEDLLLETREELYSKGIPNYFGYQRFGTVRPNTHIVGKKIVQGDLKGAVMHYLGHPFPKEREDAKQARQFLTETEDFREALKIFPTRLNFERSMLDKLAQNPKDYAGALRRLPKKLRRMLVHAYQSYLFNKILSRAIEEGLDIKNLKIDIFGYKTELPQGKLGEIEREILESEGIQLKDFKIKSMPELSVKGEQRRASINTEISFKVDQDELNPEKNKIIFTFELPAGSYATTVLREFMKADPLKY